MAKELPYFRFTVSEWLNDDISLESYKVQGVFSSVCAFYWFQDCSITKAKLEKRFNDAIEEIEYLIELGIIKECSDDLISIKFLDEQYDMLSEKRKNRVEAGRKGGKAKASNAKAKLKQSSSYKDKDKDKDNNIYPFEDFWNDYGNKKEKPYCEKKWKSISDKDKKLIREFIPIYKKHLNNSDYLKQKYPKTFLNQQTWKDDWSEYKTVEYKQGMGQFLI